jgi:hypothetical protein
MDLGVLGNALGQVVGCRLWSMSRSWSWYRYKSWSRYSSKSMSWSISCYRYSSRYIPCSTSWSSYRSRSWYMVLGLWYRHRSFHAFPCLVLAMSRYRSCHVHV